MKSKIYLEDEIGNTERKFGAAMSYQPVLFIDMDGNETPGMFTRHEMKIARERAARNPEDMPEKKTVWEWLTGNNK